MKVKWLHVVRDIAFIWGVTFIIGYLLGLAMANQGKEITPGVLWPLTVLANTAAFCFVGCLTPKHRWKHLLCVAIGVWLTSIILNVYLPNAGAWGSGRMVAWFVGMTLVCALVDFVTMVIGGVLSCLFVRTPKETPAEPTPGEPTDGKTDG